MLPMPSPAVEYAEVQRKPSVDMSATFSPSPQTAQPISSSPSSGLSVSSGPSSPNHTEDEKQENESNEKTDLFDEIITECKYNLNFEPIYSISWHECMRLWLTSSSPYIGNPRNVEMYTNATHTRTHTSRTESTRFHVSFYVISYTMSCNVWTRIRIEPKKKKSAQHLKHTADIINMMLL